MKKWTGGGLITVLAFVLFASYSFISKSGSPKKQSAYDFFNPHRTHDDNPSGNAGGGDDKLSPEKSKGLRTFWKKPHVRYMEGLSDLYSLTGNITRLDSSAFLVWGQMRYLFPRSDALPDTAQGIKEAVDMLKDLLVMIEKDNFLKLGNDSTDKTCPQFVNQSNSSFLSRNGSFLEIPCGLVEDSSVTVIGIPNSQQETFEIELVGSQIEEEVNPPIVLLYKVSLPGENLTKEPVTIQNTWTEETGWGVVEKCPDHDEATVQKGNQSFYKRILNGRSNYCISYLVDGLVKCNTQVVHRIAKESLNASHPANQTLNNASENNAHGSASFHFVEGTPFTATLWAGGEGFHMTVNGRHETSFTYRQKLEPWLVNRVNVRGGLDTLSILAKGLPVSQDLDLITDAEHLKAPKLSNKRLVLLIGVFSAANNFERRMALRRTWMQYGPVRSGDVAVRFLIGLHKNKAVNFELWREAQAYGDIQLMPFVDYYNLLTYKTIAICILGTTTLPAKYIMKTDDDAFVRIDEVLSSLEGKASSGMLHGRISFDSSPHREKDNKWYISEEEWPHSAYPPWAHGPGYIISQDIAKFIVRGHKQRELMLFKLEDVAVGIWIEQFGKNGWRIEYINDDRFYNAGCESNYVLAHYQNPRKMLCLWEKLQKQQSPECCE